MVLLEIGCGAVVLVYIGASIKTVNPRYRAIVERLGKYNRYLNPGIHFVPAIFEKIRYRDITQQIKDVTSPNMITKDALNLQVAAQVYHKVNATETDVKNSFYEVDDFRLQIEALATTTLRAIIGTKTLVEANTQRTTLNSELADALELQSKAWGVQIVRAELKELKPPEEVQKAMDNVIVSKQNMDAAVNNANTAQTNADGVRMAAIKQAEGKKQAQILEAEGQAQAIQLVNEAAQKFFKGAAVEKYKLDVVLGALQNSSKIIVPEGSDLTNVVSELAGIVPLPGKKEKDKDK